MRPNCAQIFGARPGILEPLVGPVADVIEEILHRRSLRIGNEAAKQVNRKIVRATKRVIVCSFAGYVSRSPHFSALAGIVAPVSSCKNIFPPCPRHRVPKGMRETNEPSQPMKALFHSQ
ncbi:MAG: hypothetical protein DMG32_22670 [Acidobacteria bacterium]|nr:MAG: hypothetical protein DMG32_22670 [Acidobacteriota bacterium]